MTDKNVNTEIRKEFCPNCEAETPCTHEAELFVCDICGEDFAKYIVSRSANVSDVSVTQDVLTDIKTGRSVENTNPDYYKDELYLDEDFRTLAKTYPADVSAIGVTTLIDYVEAVEAELARRINELHYANTVCMEQKHKIARLTAELSMQKSLVAAREQDLNELHVELAALKSEIVSKDKKVTDYEIELRQLHKYDKTCSTCRYLDENQNCVLGIRCVNYTLWQGRIL